MHYCKADLQPHCDHKTNCKCKPLIITDISKKSTKNVRGIKLDLWEQDEYGILHPVRIQCNFMNSKGKAKASGARAVLEILK
jgi:hypothetical protein